MTATTGTTGTAGTLPLWEAYDEAMKKNGWEKDGLMERAVLGMAFAKMLGAWETYASFPLVQVAGGFPFARYFEILSYGNGRLLCVDLGQAGVVRMTNEFGVDQPEHVRLLWLADFYQKEARRVFGTCVKDGFDWRMIDFSRKLLAIEAGCDEEAYRKSLEFGSSPMRIPLDAIGEMSKEDAERMIADLKKMGGEA